MKCGISEDASPFATVEMILLQFPFIPLKEIPQKVRDGIVLEGSSLVHPYDDMGVCSAEEDAFFVIRALVREHTSTLINIEATIPDRERPKRDHNE